MLKKVISNFVSLAIIVGMFAWGGIVSAGDVVTSLYVDRSSLEITFSEAVTDEPSVTLTNCVDNPQEDVTGLTPTYDGGTQTLKVSFGDYRIPLDTLHVLDITYNETVTESRYFILKKLLADDFESYSSSDELKANWTGGGLSYYDANGNTTQDEDESNMWKPGNVWQGAFPKSPDWAGWSNYVLEFDHVMGDTWGAWGAAFFVQGATDKVDKDNFSPGTIVLLGPGNDSGDGFYLYNNTTDKRAKVFSTPNRVSVVGDMYNFKASVVNGVLRAKITGSNGLSYNGETKMTIDTNTYALNTAGNIGILDGGKNGLNDNLYLYTYQEITPPESIHITDWSAAKESASITFNTTIDTSAANLALADITDEYGAVIPTVKQATIDKITFTRENGKPFDLDCEYRFVLSPGFSDMTGATSLRRTINKAFILKTLFSEDFEGYVDGVGFSSEWSSGAWDNTIEGNAKLRSNNAWKGFSSSSIKNKSLDWDDYVLEYTATRGGSQFIFGSGVRIQDFSNNNANNGTNCTPGGYIYMSSYNNQSGSFLKNASSGGMSKVSSAGTLPNNAGDALNVRMEVKGDIISTLVQGSGYFYSNTTTVNNDTYNYPKTGGVAFNTANESTVYFDDILVYTATAVAPIVRAGAISATVGENNLFDTGLVEGTAEISLDFINKTDDPYYATLIASLSDRETDSLYDLSTVGKNIDPYAVDDDARITVNMLVPENPQNYRLRIFLWDNFENIRPIDADFGVITITDPPPPPPPPDLSINVKTHHGATGDGITNDRAAVVAAINAAQSGDVVFFPAGIYHIGSAIGLSKSNITLRGEEGTILTNTSASGATIDKQIFNSNGNLSNVTIENLTFLNTQLEFNGNYTTSNITIQNCTFKGSVIDGHRRSIGFYSGSDLLISNNQFLDTGTVMIYNTANTTIKDNHFDGVIHPISFIRNVTSANCDNLKIIGNYARRLSRMGIEAQDQTHSANMIGYEVRDNYFEDWIYRSYGAYQGMIDRMGISSVLGSQNGFITGNTFILGDLWEESIQGVAAGNYDTRSWGMEVSEHNVTVENNHVEGFQEAGIQNGNGTNTLIRNNLIKNNATGISTFTYKDGSGNPRPTAVGMTIEGNLIENSVNYGISSGWDGWSNIKIKDNVIVRKPGGIAGDGSSIRSFTGINLNRQPIEVTGNTIIIDKGEKPVEMSFTGINIGTDTSGYSASKLIAENKFVDLGSGEKSVAVVGDGSRISIKSKAFTDPGSYWTGPAAPVTSGENKLTLGGEGVYTYNEPFVAVDNWFTFAIDFNSFTAEGGWQGFFVQDGGVPGEVFWNVSNGNAYGVIFKENQIEFQRNNGTIIGLDGSALSSGSATVANDFLVGGQTYIMDFGIFDKGTATEIILRVDGVEKVKIVDATPNRATLKSGATFNYYNFAGATDIYFNGPEYIDFNETFGTPNSQASGWSGTLPWKPSGVEYMEKTFDGRYYYDGPFDIMNNWFAFNVEFTDFGGKDNIWSMYIQDGGTNNWWWDDTTAFKAYGIDLLNWQSDMSKSAIAIKRRNGNNDTMTNIGLNGNPGGGELEIPNTAFTQLNKTYLVEFGIFDIGAATEVIMKVDGAEVFKVVDTHANRAVLGNQAKAAFYNRAGLETRVYPVAYCDCSADCCKTCNPCCVGAVCDCAAFCENCFTGEISNQSTGFSFPIIDLKACYDIKDNIFQNIEAVYNQAPNNIAASSGNIIINPRTGSDTGTALNCTTQEYPIPQAKITRSQNGAAEVFSASESTGAVSYLWVLGDGTIKSGVTVEHTYTSPVEQTCYLIATSADGTINIAKTLIVPK